MRAAFLCVFAFLGTAAAQIKCTVTGVGCMTDPDLKNRALIVQTGPFTLTREACAERCFLAGFKLSGVEFGSQCFCGNEINPLSPSKKTDDAACEAMKCPGDASEGCGDANTLYVSQATCDGARAPNYQSCLDEGAAGRYGFCNPALSVAQRTEDLLGRLSDSEIIGLISPMPSENTCECHTQGVDRLGISEWMWLVETNTAIASKCFGPERCATLFNGPLGMAASFNRTSWRLKGEVFGTEMRAFSNALWPRGDQTGYIGLTGFGPNINIARDPRFGRTSELAGEDPLLAGEYATEFVQGMQEEDANGHPKMLAYLKHFTAYSTETNRGHDNYEISPYDFWDTYLPQYERAFLKGRASGVMCSYNAINGAPSCANDYILNKVMRDMWSPDALTTTDCGAVTNLRGAPVNAASDELAAAMALNNGTDVEMGSGLFNTTLASAISKGFTSMEVVRGAARRVLLQMFKLGRFDPLDSIEWSQITHEAVNSTAHQAIQYDAALQSFVLLKNEAHTLPLKQGAKIAVLGPMGVTTDGVLSDYAGDQQCFNGQDCIVTVAEGITRANSGGETVVAKGVDVKSDDTSGIAAALALAKESEVVVLVVGNDRSIEHEGVDRSDTALPGLQDSFARQVLALGKPTVLVLVNGGALAIDGLVANSSAIVEAYSPGVVGGKALGETLLGVHNRWGKLVTTMYPHNYINEQSMVNYDMSSYPGRTYKYYQGKPLFAFGTGLSYTNFSLACDRSGLMFECDVTNIGHREGDEVVQVYHSVSQAINASVTHPVPIRHLVGFERVSLAAGATQKVFFPLTEHDFSLVNAHGNRVVYPGQHFVTFTGGDGNDVTVSVEIGTAEANPNSLSPQ